MVHRARDKEDQKHLFHPKQNLLLKKQNLLLTNHHRKRNKLWHIKKGKVVRNDRDSNPSYLGLKVADGQSILAGTIILKQRGTKFHPGVNVKRANDDSLFATSDGVVQFGRKGRNRKIVTVVSSD